MVFNNVGSDQAEAESRRGILAMPRFRQLGAEGSNGLSVPSAASLEGNWVQEVGAQDLLPRSPGQLRRMGEGDAEGVLRASWASSCYPIH